MTPGAFALLDALVARLQRTALACGRRVYAPKPRELVTLVARRGWWSTRQRSPALR
jgi:hypothetical protein